ncbi:MAG: hypothetical protein V2B18_15175 [Pseudomonadota bacterium]
MAPENPQILIAKDAARWEAFSLRDTLDALFRRVYLLGIVIFLLPVSTLVTCFFVTPIFETGAKVLVTGKQEQRNLLLSSSRAASSGSSAYINLNVDESDLNSEMAILQSIDLWTRTVQKLGPGFFEGKKKDVISITLESLLARIKRALGISGLKRLPAKDTEGPEALRALARSLSGSLKIDPVPKSKVLELSFTFFDPEKARTILATHLALYIPYQMEVYSTPAAENFFSNERTVYLERFQKAETNLTEFKTKWGLSYPEKQKEESLSEIKRIRDSLVEVDSFVSQYNGMLADLRDDQVPTGKLASSGQANTDNLVVNVIGTQLLRAMQKKIELERSYSPESREYVSAVNLVTKLKAHLHFTLELELKTLLTKKVSLEESLKKKEQDLLLLDERTQEAKKLELEAALAKERYLQYLGKEEDARLENLIQRQQFGNVRVVSQPYLSTAPKFPKKALYIIVAFVLSFPLGLGLMMFANFVDHTFSTPNQVEAATGYKVVASFKKITANDLGEP